MNPEVDSVRCERCDQSWKIRPPKWHARCSNENCPGYQHILIPPRPADQRYVVFSCPIKGCRQFKPVKTSDLFVTCSCCQDAFVIENVVVERQNGQDVYSAVALNDLINARQQLREKEEQMGRRLLEEKTLRQELEKKLCDMTASQKAIQEQQLREKEEFEQLRQQEATFFAQNKDFLFEGGARLELAEERAKCLEKELAEKTKEAEELKKEVEEMRKEAGEELKKEMERLRREKEVLLENVSNAAAVDRTALMTAVVCAEKAFLDQKAKLDQMEKSLEEYKLRTERDKQQMEEELQQTRNTIDAQKKELVTKEEELEGAKKINEELMTKVEESLALVDKVDLGMVAELQQTLELHRSRERLMEEQKARIEEQRKQIEVLSVTTRNLSSAFLMFSKGNLQKTGEEFSGKTTLFLPKNAMEIAKNETCLSNSETFYNEVTLQSQSNDTTLSQENLLKRRLEICETHEFEKGEKLTKMDEGDMQGTYV